MFLLSSLRLSTGGVEVNYQHEKLGHEIWPHLEPENFILIVYFIAGRAIPQEDIECSPGCPIRFLNNGRCDSSFNCLTSECSFDGGGEHTYMLQSNYANYVSKLARGILEFRT